MTGALKLFGNTPPAVQNVVYPTLLQESDPSIPQGIPALFAYSKMHTNDHKNMITGVLQHHVGSVPRIRQVAVACGLIYLSRRSIGSVLSSFWNGMEEGMDEFITEQLLQIKPGDLPKPVTVTLTATVVKELNDCMDAIIVRLDEYKATQEDLLTANCALADEVERLEKQAKADAAQSDARIRALNEQLEGLRADLEYTETDRDDWIEVAEETQTELDDAKDARDTWKETFEAVEQQTDVKAVRALRHQATSDNTRNERRIQGLETQLGFEKTNREEAQQAARDLRDSSKKLKDELKAEEKANEEKDEEIAGLKAENDRLEAELKDLSERCDAQIAERIGAAETAASDNEDMSQQNEEPIFRRSEERNTEGAPLRRTQSAPLWRPLPHHGDTFDPLYDVSDYGDGDSDDEDDSDSDDEDDDDSNDEDGDEEGGDEYNGNHDDEHGSANDNEDGPHDDDKKHEDGSVYEGNDGADNVADHPDLAQEGHDADSPGLLEDTSSSSNNEERPADLPTPDPSPRRAPSSMNGSAAEFVPSVRQKRPVLPILLHHQAYIASQQGVNSPDSDSASASPSPKHTPSPKAAGPEEAKNAHIQELNKEVKRLEWRRKSGMPDLVEDREGVAGPEDVLGKDLSFLPSQSSCDLTNHYPDGMYDRQVTQSLSFTPIRCARGSTWGAFNDIPNPLENMSVPVEENVPASSSIQQSQEDTPRGQTPSPQPATTLPNEANASPYINEEISQATGDSLGQKASEKTDESNAATKKVAAEQSSVPNSSAMSEAENGSGNEEDWSDVEVEEHEEEGEDDGAPMLGNYKVTRDPQPTEDISDMPMLGNYKVTRPETPASITSGTPEADEESGDTSQACSPRPDPEGGLPQQGVTPPLTVPQPLSPKREPSTMGTTESAPNGPPKTRRPSNFFPGSENATTTHNEVVGDAFADYVREHGKKTLADSMWADKSEAETHEIPQPASSTPAAGVAPPNTTNIFGTGPATRSPARGPPNFSGLPKPQPPPGAPTGPRGHVSQNPGPEGLGSRGETGSGSWSPRGNRRGGRGGRGGRGARFPQEPNAPGAATNNRNNQTPPANRGGGRGGQGTPTPQPGPARGSSAANSSFQRWQERLAKDAAEAAKRDQL